MEKIAFTVAILLAIVFTVFIGKLTYDMFEKDNTEVIESCNNESINYVRTVEEAMREFNDEVEADEIYKKYLSFPPSIMQALFEQIGTNKSIADYVYEYEKNTNYYISKQIGSQLEEEGLKIKGPDGDRIEQIEIKTKLKDRESDKTNIKTMANDSLK